MSVVTEFPLPGIGVRYEFVTQTVTALASSTTARAYASSSCSNATTRHITRPAPPRTRGRPYARRAARRVAGGEGALRAQRDVEGLAVDRLPIGAGSSFDGKTIGDTGARTRTGVSIVAVCVTDRPFPRRPEFELRGGDMLVVVGRRGGSRNWPSCSARAERCTVPCSSSSSVASSCCSPCWRGSRSASASRRSRSTCSLGWRSARAG